MLNAETKPLQAQIEINDTLHKEREKELLYVISVANRKIKKQSKQLENYKSNIELIHLREIVERRGLEITKLNKKINEFYMVNQ